MSTHCMCLNVILKFIAILSCASLCVKKTKNKGGRRKNWTLRVMLLVY